MLTITSSRARGSERFDMGSHTADLFSALQSLCKYELAFGGKITGCSKTSITIQTVVFNCIDSTSFSGTKEEIEYLRTAIALYFGMSKQFLDKDIESAIKFSNGSPLILTAAGGGLPEVLCGKRYSEVAITVALTKNIRYAKKLLSLFNGDNLYKMLEKYFKKYLNKDICECPA